jgi:hypothetical protein
MRVAHTVTARKAFTCHGYRCPRLVMPGEDYARHVAFPGNEIHDSPAPWVLKLCQDCHTTHGVPMPPRRSRRRPQQETA